MKIDFEKGNGLVPAIIQDARTAEVLMLGYMNEEAYKKTCNEGKVSFYSRSKQRIWTKGESSGNYLYAEDIKIDCDNDTLLVLARPAGPVCHTGADTCFGESSPKGFLYKLEDTIKERIKEGSTSSYTSKLFKRGTNKVAQKVGEEAVELVIEAMDNNDEQFIYEAADLLYHLLILLQTRDKNLIDVEEELLGRSK